MRIVASYNLITYNKAHLEERLGWKTFFDFIGKRTHNYGGTSSFPLFKLARKTEWKEEEDDNGTYEKFSNFHKRKSQYFLLFLKNLYVYHIP